MEISIEKALDSLKILQEGGYIVPDALVEYVKNEAIKENKESKVLQIWSCKNCGLIYESEVRLQEINHQCSQLKSRGFVSLRLVWERVKMP